MPQQNPKSNENVSENVTRMTVPKIIAKKAAGERLVMVTAYDAAMGRLVDEAGVDIVLVGDSLGMVVLGYDSTLPVTTDQMLHHTAAVRRGVKRALVVGDMPFGSFHGDVAEAVLNATRFLKETGADAVKLEGGERVAPHVKRMSEMGIPVMGHIGMTPQSVRTYGGFKVQGRAESEKDMLINDAKALEQAGAFAIVVECVPYALGAQITEELTIPTIGIGAGESCDGQVLVLNDMLGLVEDFKPKFVKRYANLSAVIRDAVRTYADEVRTQVYPGKEHRYE